VAQEQVARGDLIVKQSALRVIIGRDAGTLLPLRDRPTLTVPEPADVEAWAKRAEDESYGVAVARDGAEIARIATLSARNGHAPTLDLSATRATTTGFGIDHLRRRGLHPHGRGWTATDRADLQRRDHPESRTRGAR